ADFRGSFSPNKTWNQIRVTSEKTPWTSVYGSLRSSSVCFFLLACYMSTYDSLGSTSELENLKSPIFACLYSYTVWIEVVGTMFTHDPDPDWDTTLELLTTQVYNRLTFVLMCMVFQVTIYYIWIEHNKKIHNESFKPPAKLWQRFTRRFTIEFFLQDIMSDQSFEGFSNAGFPRGEPL
ncbi:hypothetical protein HID58_067286, partial [Brassica napus]